MRAYLGLLLIIMVPFSQAAIIKGDNGVEILAMDGHKFSSSLLADKQLTATEGEHQVVVKYSQHFKNGETVSSKPHIFNLNINGDTEISIKKLHSADQAKREIKQGLNWLVTNAQQTLEITASETLSGEGFMPYRDIEKLIANYNRANGMTTNADIAVNEHRITGTKIEQLMQLYNTATINERKAFRLWLVEQEMK